MTIPIWVFSVLFGALAGCALLLVIALAWLVWKVAGSWKGIDLW